MSSINEPIRMIADAQVGATVSVCFLRGAERRSADVVIGEQPVSPDGKVVNGI